MSAENLGLSGRPKTQEHYHAFLSHNGADKALVEEIANQLPVGQFSAFGRPQKPRGEPDTILCYR